MCACLLQSGGRECVLVCGLIHPSGCQECVVGFGPSACWRAQPGWVGPAHGTAGGCDTLTLHSAWLHPQDSSPVGQFT